MIVFNILGALVVFVLVFVGQFWFLSRVEPPGGVIARAVYLIIMVAIALLFAWGSMQTNIGAPDY